MAALKIDIEKVVRQAESQLGVHEEPYGSNRRPFGRWYGMNGVAWCAIFWSWCAAMAGFIQRISTSKGASYCPSVVDWARSHGYWRPSSSSYEPKRGDGIVFDFIGRPSHIGWVTGRTTDGRNITVEGNTNGSGSRDGGAVVRHYRSRRGTTIGYIEVQNVRRPTKPVITTPVPSRAAWPLGYKGADMRLFQVMLNKVTVPMGLGDRKLLVLDGELGPRTASRFFEFERKYRRLQDRAGVGPKLHVDYVPTQATITALAYCVERVRRTGRY